MRDVEPGIYFDPGKMHVLDHQGKYLKVRGPLNIARPVQGWPVIVQAGASDDGRQLAAETAEAVFTAQSDLGAGRAFYADLKGRMAKLGRAREHMQYSPACFSSSSATRLRRRAPSARSSTAWSTTPTPSPPYLSRSATTPPNSIRTGRCRKTFRKATLRRAAGSGQLSLAGAKNSTVRQLAQRLGGYAGLAMVGTPATIADEMEEWLGSEGSDGLTVMFPVFARRARRFRRPPRSGIAAARSIPA